MKNGQLESSDPFEEVAQQESQAIALWQSLRAVSRAEEVRPVDLSSDVFAEFPCRFTSGQDNGVRARAHT